MLGKAVIRGTRIPVELLLRKLVDGATEHAAMRYAADSLAHEEVVFRTHARPHHC
jgi:uncharacterized protein (DUF433 family)